MNQGFIKLHRGSETLELLSDPNAFILLTVIALRVRRTDEFNIHNLKSGEALIGDYKRYGMSEQQYRSAMKRLGQWGFAAFKPTTRGTVARLLDTRVYDINEASAHRAENERTTDKPQTTNERATTNKNEKKKKEKNEKKYPPHSDEWRLAELLLTLILEDKQDFRRPQLKRWAGDVDRMIRIDGRSPERIEAVIRWCRRDPFWSRNILSPAKLRKHFDRLEMEADGHSPKESLRDQIARMEREGTL